MYVGDAALNASLISLHLTEKSEKVFLEYDANVLDSKVVSKLQEITYT